MARLSDAFQAKPCDVALWKKAVIVEISEAGPLEAPGHMKEPQIPSGNG